MALVTFTTLFAVLSAPDNHAVALAIVKEFPAEHISFGPGQWFVVASGTAKDLSDKIGVTDGSSGSAVILAVSGYYGRASSEVWEWIAAKLGKPTNG